MNDGNGDRGVMVRVHVQQLNDGSYRALDASDSLVAQGEDFVDLRTNLEAAIRRTHGATARPLLVVGRRPTV